MLSKKIFKVAVTGANGYIGSHVTDELVKAGHQVIACDINNSNITPKAEYININILEKYDSTDLFSNIKKPDHIIHLAWQDGFNHASMNHLNNLIKHFYFLKNVIDAGCKSLTVMGTVHEIGYHEGQVSENTPCNPLSFYGIAKNSLRQMLFTYAKNKDISIKWLRAYYITGDDKFNHSVFTKILEMAEQGKKEFPFTKGENQFDFININNLAEMICAAATQSEINGIINVCSGQPISMKDKVEEFKQQHNLDINFLYGAFPSREYDSPIIYGDNTKIKKIMELSDEA